MQFTKDEMFADIEMQHVSQVVGSKFYDCNDSTVKKMEKNFSALWKLNGPQNFGLLKKIAYVMLCRIFQIHRKLVISMIYELIYKR